MSGGRRLRPAPQRLASSRSRLTWYLVVTYYGTDGTMWYHNPHHGATHVARAAVLVAARMSANPSAVVRLRQVAKTYRSGTLEVPALRGIRLEIPSHRFSVVVGASGSGKTTLLNLIGCIDSPSSGPAG